LRDFDKIIDTNNDQSKFLLSLPFGSTHGASKGFAAWWKKFYAHLPFGFDQLLVRIDASFMQLASQTQGEHIADIRAFERHYRLK
jgi:hypothetical protein